MTQCFRRGIFAVATPDRFEDLRRMVTSLWRNNTYQIQVMIARDWEGAHEIKSRMGSLSTFDSTVFLDTDIYVNGDISKLFEIAESGKLGIYRHLTRGGGSGDWNSGVMCFNKEVGRRLSEEWAPRRKLVASKSPGSLLGRSYWKTDQKSLNEIIDNYPIHKLPAAYNYIIPERTLGEETIDYPKVKIFHFIHKRCFYRHLCRSYKEWKQL